MNFKNKKTAGVTLLLTAAVLAVLAGCSGSARVARQKSVLSVPPGVDSTVAVLADSISDRLFVSIEREAQADRLRLVGKSRASRSDTLWQALSTQPERDFVVTGRDSLRAVEAFNAGALKLQELAALEKSQSAQVQQAQVKRLLVDAQQNFERAVVLNPFDLDTKSWLARVYQTLAARFLEEENHKKATEILENLLRIERGEHALYGRLAEAYYALQDWEAANQNFAMAEAVLRGTAGLDLQNGNLSSNVEPSTLFYYVYYQADTEIKMHDSARGQATLNRALEYANTEKEKADIQSYLTWVNWDDGNIAAVELRDKLLILQDTGDYEAAARGFDKLNSLLRSRAAKDETNWRLAVLEFQFLNRQERGIARLQEVVRSARKNPDGTPADSSYQAYFNSYGVMCHNLGLKNVQKNRKLAFTYFQQAVTVPWENQSKSHLELAKLSRNDPKSVIAHCHRALSEPAQLESGEELQAYQLMVEALKRSGRFPEARTYYARWMELRNSDRRVSR